MSQVVLTTSFLISRARTTRHGCEKAFLRGVSTHIGIRTDEADVIHSHFVAIFRVVYLSNTAEEKLALKNEHDDTDEDDRFERLEPRAEWNSRVVLQSRRLPVPVRHRVQVFIRTRSQECTCFSPGEVGQPEAETSQASHVSPEEGNGRTFSKEHNDVHLT
ncbi:hypothetical protein EDB84DRAFT_316207 [Lactarius hengduanensis]|nr:hypothetical protein EDB84DRAFT_316207 [Lactarius hengduanensis]